jgi:hypothetical protein
MESKKRIARQILYNQKPPTKKLPLLLIVDMNKLVIDVTLLSFGVKLEHCYSCVINITINNK